MKRMVLLLACACGMAMSAFADTLWSTPWYVNGCHGNYKGVDLNLAAIAGRVNESTLSKPFDAPYSASVSLITLGLNSSSDWENDSHWNGDARNIYLVVVKDNEVKAVSAKATKRNNAVFYPNQSNKAAVDFAFTDFVMESEIKYQGYFVTTALDVETPGISVGDSLTTLDVVYGRFIGYTYDNVNCVYSDYNTLQGVGKISPVVQYSLGTITPKGNVLTRTVTGSANNWNDAVWGANASSPAPAADSLAQLTVSGAAELVMDADSATLLSLTIDPAQATGDSLTFKSSGGGGG